MYTPTCYESLRAEPYANRRCTLFVTLLAVLVGVLTSPSVAHAEEVIRVGVIASRGIEPTRKMWGPTAEYLTKAIPGKKFEIVPMDLAAVRPNMEQGRLHFFITNPGEYAVMEHDYGISRISTLRYLGPDGEGHTRFGGVIFCRADRADIKTLKDLRGKSFMGVSRTSFGGFQVAQHTMLQQGIDPMKDFRSLEWGEFPQENVVHAVRDKRVDCGTVRTGMLEELAQKKAIRLEDYSIINAQHVEGFPFLLSTKLYPEWAFATLSQTSEKLAHEVAAALLKLPADHPAARAAKTAGWTVPLDYQPVHVIFKDLKYGPYAHYGEVTWRDTLRAYWHVLFGILVAIAVMIVVTVHVLGLNKKLGREMAERIERTKQIRAILDNVVFGFLRVDSALVVKDGYTRSCRDLLGTDAIAGQNLCDLLRLDKARERAELKLNADQVFEDVLPEELNIEQLPRRFVMPDSRVLNVEARVVRDDDGKVAALLMTISDVTQLETVQRENEDNRALLNILRQKASFEGFLAETKEQLRSAHQALEAKDVAHVRRVAHTIKGNVASYGVVQLAKLIHQIEEQPDIERQHIDRITGALRDFLEEHRSVLGVVFDAELRRRFVVSEEQLQDLRWIRTMLPSELRARFDQTLRELSLTPAGELLGPVQSLGEMLAARLGKEVDVRVVGGDLRVDATRLSPVFQNLPHLIRNAMDHGIESPGERGDKPARAELVVSVSETPSEYVITVQDDGRGIPADAVVGAAIDKGIITEAEAERMSADEKVMLIFRDRVSTAAEVTDISGRGVGMAAVLADVERAGGTVRVHAEPGKGTKFELVVPVRAEDVRAARNSQRPPKRASVRPSAPPMAAG